MQNKKPKCYLPYEYIYNSNGTKHSFYKTMFIEDVMNKIIPISFERNKDNSKTILHCNKNDLNLIKNVLNSFNIRQGKEDNINKLILNTIKEIARNIAWYGESMYEICKVSDNDIRVVGLIPNNFFDFKFFYIQMPPKRKNNFLSPKIINNKYLWKVSVPKILEKNYSLKTILSRIDQFDSFMPKAMKNDLYKNNDTSSYDYKKYDEKCFVFVNDLTRDWGWDQRQWTSNSKTTEFYNMYKQIKFKYSISILREHVIFELNNLFFRLGIEAKIKLENIPSSNEYKEKIENFLNGQLSYNKMMEFLY
ncbi:hypothetical protein ACOTWI_09185 [Aliarcobacter butzleri]